MKKILLFLTLLNGLNVFCQNTEYIPQIVPPSPDVYKMSRYGDIQLQGNTGAFTHSIPIYNVIFHNINLPITISYSSNGVLIDELSGFTGTSWNLNAGGVISRTVRGIADEKAEERWYPDSIEPLNTFATKIKLYADKDNNTRDSQQDWFFVNIGSISTSFFFDENLKILKSNDDDIKIEYTLINNILEFKITDKNGTTYILGGSDDYSEKNTMSQDCSTGPKTTNYTAWYLKEITTFNNKKITFNYNSFQQSYTSSASYTETYTETCTLGAPLNTIFDRNSFSCRTINKISSKALSSINFGDDKVVFNYKNDRKDEGILLLSNISVFNNAKLLKRDEFIYHEIYNNQKVQDPRLTSNPSLNYRYFLKEIVSYNDNNSYLNSHSFEYYNLSDLPPRLSWNKDIYGYYNGKSNSSPFDKNLIVNPETKFITRNYATYFSGDLSVNPSTSYYGMLKKIIYPTKGYSNIQYESNASNVNNMKDILEENSLEAYKNRCDLNVESSPESSFEFISNGEAVHFQTDYGVEKCQGVYVNDFHDVYNISIYNITNGQNTLIFSSNGRYDKIIRTATEGETANGESIFSPIKTFNNNKYKVVIKAETRLNSVSLIAHFQYNKKTVPYINNQYYGGVRVKSVIDFDGNSNTIQKDYFYNSFDKKNTGFTTIKEANTPKLFEKIRYTKYCEGEGSLCGSSVGLCLFPIDGAIKLTLNNSSINQLFNTRSQSVGYDIITSISTFNNINNGYTENYYYNLIEDNSDTYYGNKIYGVPNSNESEGFSSYLLESKIFNSNNILLTKIENSYQKIKENKIYRNWVFKKDYDLKHPVMENWIENHSIERYQNYSQTIKPSKTTTTEYFENNTTPVVTETIYNYDSPNHLQLTKQTTTNSKAETLINEYQYPPDLVNQADYSTTDKGLMNRLISENRISEPVITKQKVGYTYISEIHNQYSLFNNIIQKSAVHQKKGSGININQTTDRVIKYDSYDNYGNITQYTPENGIPVSIIWGYNGQYPVAKIEGSTYTNTISKLSSYLSKIQNGTLSIAEESTIRGLIPDAMITTYQYKPLVGVTKIVQQNGMAENYKYDSANRLQEIRNDTGELLKSFQYNYKP